MKENDAYHPWEEKDMEGRMSRWEDKRSSTDEQHEDAGMS